MTELEMESTIIEWATNYCSIQLGEEVIGGVQVTLEDRQSIIKSTIGLIHGAFEGSPELRERHLAGDKEEFAKALDHMFDNMWLFGTPGWHQMMDAQQESLDAWWDENKDRPLEDIESRLVELENLEVLGIEEGFSGPKLSVEDLKSGHIV